MSKRSEMIYKAVIMITDICSIIFSYFFSFYLRTNVDVRPFFFHEQSIDFISTILLLIPFWIIILGLLGLYRKETLFAKTHLQENFRLIAASLLGVMLIITISFLKMENIFPVRLVAIYTFLLCAFFLICFRSILRCIKKIFLKKGNHGTVFVLIVGNSDSTQYLAKYFQNNLELGYRVVGIVSNKHYIPKQMSKKQYSSVKEAIKKTRPDIIFQTDSRNTNYVYRQALNLHIPYYYVPSEDILFSQMGELELIGDTPAILIKTTPLDGWGKIIKRTCDIVFSLFSLIILAIPICAIWLIIKISDRKSAAIYSDIRLTKHNRKFKIYKFRSMKAEYCGMLPEKAFEKMGHPELSEQYRKNGDYLENDPRITKIGAFLRKTSLDELPQLWNILKGDISLVGPRALVPGELNKYGNRSQLLTVKSGLTGLAQVSGRREIPFEERRKIDLYYIHNWSISLDFQILLKTILVVLRRDGAK